MFYSHEVLTSRKYGVATVWLVATLGSKSMLKKVSRKAILDVDVPKACETIIEPAAPMALRLQSSLLYGVSRVYLQQCGYVLADAESATTTMRSMLRSMTAEALGAEGANKAKPGQLVLEDDPNFFPDFDLMPLNTDLIDLAGHLRDSQSNLSPNGSSHRTTTSHRSISGLMMPPSNSSFVQGYVGGLDLLDDRDHMSSSKRLGTPRLLEDDLGFMLDDGVDRVVQDEPPNLQHAQSGPEDRKSLLNTVENEDFMTFHDEDGDFIPHHDGVTSLQLTEGPGRVQGTTSDTAMAPNVRKKRNPAVLALDREIALSNKVLSGWIHNYVQNMRDVSISKHGYRAIALAKKNAQHWVLGSGILLDPKVCDPLKMFMGAPMIKAFTGVDLFNGGQKHPRDTVGDMENGRRVRPRVEPIAEESVRGLHDPGSAQLAFQDDDNVLVMSDDTIERGREAPTSLEDHHLSSILPWNQSASSRRLPEAYATSASMGPLLDITSRRGSRLTSASPLIGRGPPPQDIDDFQLPGITGDEAFELFGPAAQVDTQTALQSQWQRAALGSESTNFLDFVQTAIAERGSAMADTIELDVLLPPRDNSPIVAAQALLHVLTLVTTNLLRAEQDMDFGPIVMSIAAI